MAIDFEKVKSEVINAGKDVGDKAKEMAAIAKVKLDIHTKEEYLDKQYALLGRAYYSAHKEDADVPEKQSMEAIREAEEDLADLKAELQVLQGK